MADVKQSTARNSTFFMVQSADHLTAATGATVTVTLSKNAGAFGAAGGAVSEIANGWYSIALNTTDTNTLGDLAIHCTATSCDPTDYKENVVANILGDTLGANVLQWNSTNVAAPATAGIPEVNIKNINNVSAASVTTINANQGTTQPLNFTGTGASALVKSDMVDILGTAVSTPATAGILDVNVKNINNVAAATPGAANGILISGSNSGTTTLGALTITGATTHTGNVSCAAGITITQSSGNTAGLSITGNGTGAGVNVTGGTTGAGILANGGGTSGSGVKLVGTAGNAIGLEVVGQGSAAGVSTTGGATGAGLKVVGGGTSGAGIAVTTTAGDGLSILPTAGTAIVATGNGTSKHGILSTGGTAGTSDGISAVAGTGGVPIRGDITGNITGNLSGSAGSVTGAVGSVTGNVGGNVVGSTASVTGAVGSVTGNVGGNVTGSVGSVVGAVGSVTGNVGGNVTGSTGSVVGAVGSVTGNVSGNVTGTIGGLTAAALKDFFDTDSTTTYASAVTGSVVKEIAANAGGSSLTVGAIVDGVWDEATSNHTTSGSYGSLFQVVRSGTAQDGTTTTITLDAGASTGALDYAYLPLYIIGGTGANQGAIITSYDSNTKVATVSPGFATAPDNTSIFVIGSQSNAATKDVANISTLTNTFVAAAVWDTVDSSRNDAGTMGGDLYSLFHTGTTVAIGGIDSAALTSDAQNTIADAILDRNMATGTDSGTNSTAVRTLRQAARLLRNKASISATTLTVTKEDDSTTSWTAGVSTTAGNPISAVDPA